MIDINLRIVAPPADFRSGVERLLREYIKNDKDASALIETLKPGEAVMFLSKGQDQIRFIYHPVDLTDVETKKKASYRRTFRSFVSVHVRLNGRLDPRMLANIAEQAGLRMTNRKRYEDYFAHLQEHRKAA